MKINWGTGVAIAMLMFMIFILSFVYKTFTNEKYDHHLVSEEYYKDEMNYQQELNEIENAKRLTESVGLINTENGIKITFPTDVKLKSIVGTIQFQRASDVTLDIELPIKLANNIQLIPKEKLVEGLYNVKINWEINKTKYQYNDKYTY